MPKRTTRQARLLAERLRAARTAAGLSQCDAAARLERPQSYVSRCESGARRVDVFELAVDNPSRQLVLRGDVRHLPLDDDAADLILTHPPYANIVKYSNGENPDDLSSLSSIHAFLDELEVGLRELYRVLKPDRYCALLMGDTRKGQHYVPLSHFVLDRCFKTGFALKEEIIKTQHNTTYAARWNAPARIYRFYLIMHEHLYILRKPRAGEDFSRIRHSVVREPPAGYTPRKRARRPKPAS